MEEGSLVQEALQYMQQSREAGGATVHGGTLQNTLWIDVFLVESSATTPPPSSSLQTLATICLDLNAAMNNILQSYPWHAGGEGPVFGMTETTGCAHLRATCRYGANVDDEWAAIAGVLQLSKAYSQLAFQCWDVDDGHVLLIEAALHLPPWVDSISPAACRYRCWIRTGSIILIRPVYDCNDHLTLRDGLFRISQESSLERPASLQNSITTRIQRFLDAIHVNPPNWKGQLHRSALIVPRCVAQLIHSHPQLVNCAVTTFSQYSYCKQPPGIIDFSDLVWTVHPCAKTSYAMLRTLVTPVWTTEDYIPPNYQGMEQRRMARACRVDSTPHLAHALQIGVRLTAGLDYILGQKESAIYDVTIQDRIMKHWASIDIACGGNGKWLQRAYLVGPNHTSHDLEPFMKCPLYNIDLNEGIPCPLSSPGKTLKALIKQKLSRCEGDNATNFAIPSSGDVDSETWMQFTEAEWEREHEAREQNATFSDLNNAQASNSEEEKQQEVLTTMLGSFQTFVEAKSDVEGISRDNPTQKEGETVEINPRIFMNLLHKVLTSSPEDIKKLVNNDEWESYFADNDDDEEEDFADEDVMGLMNAMDIEIRERGHTIDKEYTSVTEDELVLSGLLQSLDDSAGGPGPVQNMLKEMGIEPPNFQTESDD